MNIHVMFCLCLQEWHVFDKYDNPEVVAASRKLVDHINDFLKNEGLGEKCARLELQEVSFF